MSIFGTIIFVDNSDSSDTLASLAAPSLNTVLGDLLVVSTGSGSGAFPTGVTDTIGNTYIPLTGVSNGFASFEQLWYCLSSIGANAANIVTAAWGGIQHSLAIGVWDTPISGGTVSFDTATQASNTGGANAATGTFNTMGTDELVFVGVYNQSGVSYTNGSGYTLDWSNGQFVGAEHQAFSSPQTGITGNFVNASSDFAIAAAAFRAASPVVAALPVICIMN